MIVFAHQNPIFDLKTVICYDKGSVEYKKDQGHASDLKYLLFVSLVEVYS